MQEVGWIPPAKIDVSLVHGPLRKVATDRRISILYNFIKLLLFYQYYIHINEWSWTSEYIRFYSHGGDGGSWLVFHRNTFDMEGGKRQPFSLYDVFSQQNQRPF